MKVIGTVKRPSLNDAVSTIETKRPDFKIGAMFVYNGYWHAVHDDGDDSVRLICIRVKPNGDVEGVNAFGKDIDRKLFFRELNENAVDRNGKPLPSQSEKERNILNNYI